MKSRIEQLEQFVREDPNDPFSKYALALEYQKINTDKALEIFNQLLIDHRHYVPTYYHLGKLNQEYGMTVEAIRVFELGIFEAKKQNDTKALQELQAALQEVHFDSAPDQF